VACSLSPCRYPLNKKPTLERGLGPGRGRFRLEQVWARDPLGPWETLIYDGPSDTLRTVAMTAGMTDIERAAAALPEQDVTIHFLTPTEIKHDGQIVHEPAFHMEGSTSQMTGYVLA